MIAKMCSCWLLSAGLLLQHASWTAVAKRSEVPRLHHNSITTMLASLVTGHPHSGQAGNHSAAACCWGLPLRITGGYLWVCQSPSTSSAALCLAHHVNRLVKQLYSDHCTT